MTALREAVRHTIKLPSARAVGGTAVVNVVLVMLGSLGGLFLARVLGPTGRGDLVTILLWPAIIGAIVALGITAATCYWASREPAEAAGFMSTGVAWALATGFAVAICGPWLASLIARNDEVRNHLTLVLALTPVYIAGGVWISSLQATSIRWWNAARIAQPATYVMVVFGLWLLGNLTLATTVTAFAASLLVQGILSAAAARRVVGPHLRLRISLLRPLLSYGLKVSLSLIPQLVYVSLDQLLLSIMPGVPAAQLGNYAVAASLSWLALPVSMAFGSVAFPRLARAANEAGARRIERGSLIGAGIASAGTIILVSLLAPLMVPILFGNGYRDAIVALWLLAPGTVFLALSRVVGDLLQGRGQPLLRSIGEGVGAALTVVLLVVLIPRFGIRGAAIASSIAYAVVFLLLLGSLEFARRRLSIPTIPPEEPTE